MADVSGANEVNGASGIRQRKKRKWDQPAESLASSGIFVSGSTANLSETAVLGTGDLLCGIHASTLPGIGVPIPFQCATIQQKAAVIVEKLNQPKIQDEVIAREIVINDAEPTTRYKLTKRQTQEEIQKNTGAIVITRGKYRPPNGLLDHEKPLYLHISAGAQLKDTAERVKAVDHAAAIVEEILKQGQASQSTFSSPLSVANSGCQATLPFNASVFLGFEPDPALNIASRIRGPNDQYINHIMHETGVTVTLRGRGSRNTWNPNLEDTQQPLHLYLSSNNQKNLEVAKLLAENLLDTISTECGVSRASSKAYGAVPPPLQLMVGTSDQNGSGAVKSSATVVLPVTDLPVVPSALSVATTVTASAGTHSLVSSVCSQVNMAHTVGAHAYGLPQPTTSVYYPCALAKGTSYSGYGGIYPQATPLQQVALALRQCVPSATSAVLSTENSSTLARLSSVSASSIAESEKRPPTKRKFQELPACSSDSAIVHQNGGTEEIQDVTASLNNNNALVTSTGKVADFSSLPVSTISPANVSPIAKLPLDGDPSVPKFPPPNVLPVPKFVAASVPPVPKFAPAIVPSVPKFPFINVPPVPKFSFPNVECVSPSLPPKLPTSTSLLSETNEKAALSKRKIETLPETLRKLVEYGEEDDDSEETS